MAQYLAPLLGSSIRAVLPLEIRRFALWYASDRDDVERVERQGFVSNQCSGDGMIRTKIDPRECFDFFTCNEFELIAQSSRCVGMSALMLRQSGVQIDCRPDIVSA
jgi:hypothetical protein